MIEKKNKNQKVYMMSIRRQMKAAVTKCLSDLQKSIYKYIHTFNFIYFICIMYFFCA